MRVVPFDVPGHKRGRGNPELTEFLGEKCVGVDVNSMKPLDNLCHPVSVIREAEQLAADAFGASQAFLMVGGTTSAVQSMILSACKRGDKIILPRNVHKSMINALVLCGAIPVYVNPDVDKRLGISLGMKRDAVAKAIRENPDAVAVVVNNPTYYGVCSDLRAIVKMAHDAGMLCLADEAHGTHFYFGSGLPVSAMAAGVNVHIFTLVGMRLRRVIPSKIILPLVKANKAGLDVNVDQLEAHYLAGGDVDRVLDALIAAERAAIPLTFERAAAIDLAGRDVLEAVQMSVNPKVIETPLISAVAKNGIELKVRARVTVRANIARVGEGIVTTVGSSEEHTDVLENPDHISRTVLSKGLDAGSAFEILSIDIADVDVGRNIGAQLMTDQAEADKNIAQAKAEERRAMAVAKEQEMRAYTQEMQAKVVEAQAQVPEALAQALREGHLGVMDYYQMKNLLADTKMRESLVAGGQEELPPTRKSEK